MPITLPENRTRVAEVLVALGPDRAATLLRQFRPDEVQTLAADVAAIGRLGQERSHQVLQSFVKELVQRQAASGGVDYALDVLARIFGPERAEELAAQIDPRLNRPFAWLLGAPPDVVARALADEPPATVALALAHLDTDVAARILRHLPDARRPAVAIRMATLEQVAPDVVATIDASLRERLSTVLHQDVQPVAGMDLLIEILNQSPPKLQRSLLDAIRERDVTLATRIQEAMFVFEDIVRLGDRAIQEVLKSIDTMDLALALNSADAPIRDRILKNLSERARESLLEEIEYLNNPKAAETKAAKSRIVQTIRALEESGAIEIDRPVEDDDEH